MMKTILIATCLLASVALANSAPTNLRCEYLGNPLGIDVLKPRLSWVLGEDPEARGQNAEQALASSKKTGEALTGTAEGNPKSKIQNLKSSPPRGLRQTAYQVLVASSEKLLAQDRGDLWDTGKVAGDQSNQIEYAGKALESRMRCYWKVKTYTTAGDAWSQSAFWTMGLLKPGDWRARWIGLELSKTNLLHGCQWIWFPEGNPAAGAPVGQRYFRRAFEIAAGRKIAKATLQMAADDSFVVYANGQKVGEAKDFHVVSIIDLTKILQAGPNALAVVADNVGTAPTPAGLIACLKVEFVEGEPMVIPTDGQWQSSQIAESGWQQSRFDTAKWVAAKILGAFGMGPWGELQQNLDARPLPARYLRREFITNKQFVRATAHVCGLGFFDLYLNGEKVGDHVMDPVLSDYRKAAYYVTFDVTKHLQRGRNIIGVALGNGRFFAPRLRTPMATADFGFPKLRIQTEITYTDGSVEVIASDETWKITDHGPITANNEYDGETYDARLEMPGWNAAGFDDATWHSAQLVKEPGGSLTAQMMEPMRVTQTIKPVSITNPRPGIYIVDMGQNFYGTVRMKARGPSGTEVRLTSAYSLLPDGMLKTADNRNAAATDIYIFKGEGEEVWNPQFKGQGYRRVQVTGFPGTPTVENFDGLVIHTDTAVTGDFTCSNELINRIHTAMRWGMRMFLRSAPMDPDRDERQSWMGDPAKDSESEAFNFNVAAFYAKWMDDVRRSQRADGAIPEVSMYWDFGMSSIDWPSVYTIIPDWYVDFYADRRLSQIHYESMKRWVLTMDQRNRKPDGTYHGGMFGDWCDTYTMDGKCGESGKTDVGLVHTAYHYNNCRIVARAAARLGREEDVKQFNDMAQKALDAFNKKFFDSATATYGNGTQTSYVLPLAFGMVPANHRDQVIANLVHDIMVTHNGHLSGGLIGMQWLMQTLTAIGRPDVAWTIVTQTTRPSWGYMMSKGATTIWERWDTDTRDPGMNSEALLIQAGNLDAWFYQTLAGINYDKENPGFKHIILKPQPVGDLKFVKASFDSIHGLIASDWKLEGPAFVWNIRVPPNTTATVHVPTKDAATVTEGGKPAATAIGVKFLRMEKGAAVFEVGSGSFKFSSKLEK
jgi:alpha-L-rhamnosidase